MSGPEGRGDWLERTRSSAIATTLGWILVHYDFDWSGAEHEFKRALELNPNYAPAHQWYGPSYLTLFERRTEPSRK